MRAFVYPHDSYIGRHVSSTLCDLGYELLVLPESADDGAKSQFLQIADLVVLELYGNEAFAKSAAVGMSLAQSRGREQVLIGISDALVWSTCPVRPGGEDPSSTLRVTDSDWASRSPCVAGAPCHEAETAVIRAARKGRLRAHIVCPGLPYGNGEGGDVFHPLFRSSWEANKDVPPRIYGTGGNRLPLVHVSNLAKYVASVASYPPSPATAATGTASTLTATSGPASVPPPPPYLLVSDGGQATQTDVVAAVSKALGTGDVALVSPEDSLFESGIDRYTLDIEFVTTPLPGSSIPFNPSYPDGFLASVPALIDEYKQHRNLAPLRIVLTGLPMSGKTLLAARLAKQYGLCLITAQDILEAASSANPELQRAVQAELSSKEPRVSPKNMAALMQGLLSSVQIRNRGYVLDAFPSLKVPAAARFSFFKVAPMTAEETALKEAADQAAAKDPKGGRTTPPPGAAKGKDAKGKGPVGPEGPEIPPGHKLVLDPVFAPSHVIELFSEDSELLARLKLVEAAEIEAAKAAAAASGPLSSKDVKGKGKESGPTTHNNEKDFQRRKDALAKAKSEADEDLKTRIATAESTRAALQSKGEEERRKREAESNTLKARRKRAKEMAAAGLTASLTDSLDLTLSETLVAEEKKEEIKVANPEHGGTIGILVHDLGAKYAKLVNATEPNLHDLPFTGLEASAREFVGAPHNFEGFPAENELTKQVDVPVVSSNVGGQSEGLMLGLAGDVAEAAKEFDSSRRRNKATASMEKWLLSLVMPAVTQGLLQIVKDRPRDPIESLSTFLRAEASKIEAQWQSPYSLDTPAPA